MREPFRWILVAAAVVLLPQAAFPDVLPYKIEKKTLENGLDVIVIETPEFKDVLNLSTMILAGSRNEVEKGRSGLAHLFEHIAFRHAHEVPGRAYKDRMEKMGAFDNGWTWFDVTYYHPVTFASNLEALAEVQAERFVSMDFSERIYRTEAGAVLGEYRRIASDPSLRMEEVQADLAYGPEHGYGHTTMGYLADVNDMPNSYKSGRAFYETYYRPNNALVIVSGDVRSAEVFPLIEKTYGGWKPGQVAELPPAKPLDGPKRSHVDWDSDVAPRIAYAYRVPPLRPGTAESSVLLLLPELIAGETAPLYQKIRYEKKVATDMSVEGRSSQGFDSRLLEAGVRLEKSLFQERGKSLLDEVEKDVEAGLDELKAFSRRPDAAERLAATQSKFRYDLLGTLNSPHSIAAAFAWFYRFQRDLRVLDSLVEGVGKLTPKDIDAFAARHFVPSNRIVVTMSPRQEKGK